MMRRLCGGCEGQGRHWRWCSRVVGFAASMLGQQAEQAEALGDQIGPNVMGAANHCWAAAALLRKEADAAAEAYMTEHETHH